MIDGYSRLAAGKIVPNKEADTILKPFIEDWILKGYGPPRQVIFDNGREFSNKKMRELCETFNIQMLTSGGYSPWQNGLCEKNHHLIDMMIEKMMHGDSTLTLERALAAALYAKKSMINVNGYSPLQLMMGKQPRLPGPAQDNGLAANKEFSTHKLTHERISDIFNARSAFTACENSNRLKEALSRNVPKFERFEPGERCFYKFGRDPHYHGPGKVVAQDNKIVFIRHGSSVISTGVSWVQKIVQPEEEEIIILNDNKKADPGNSPPPLYDSSDSDFSDSDSDMEGQDQVPGRQPDPNRELDDSDDDWRPELRRPAVQYRDMSQSPNVQQPDMGQELSLPPQARGDPDLGVVRNLNMEGALNMTRNDGQNEEEEERDDDERQEGGEKEKESRVREEEEHEEVTVKVTKRLPAKGSWIIYKEKEAEFYFRAQVTQRVTKGTVKKNRWFNILNENGSSSCINIDAMDWALIEAPEWMNSPEIISPETGAKRKRRKKSRQTPSPSPNPGPKKMFKPSPSVHNLICYRADQIEMAEAEQVMMSTIDRKHWKEPAVIKAKEKELANFKKHEAYEWVKDIGQPRISSGWVITQKQFQDVLGAKARLVCHGNQEWQAHPSDAPTATKVGLRLLFAICAQMGWQVMTADVTSAFLQARLTRDVFVQPPKDIQRPGQIWKLRKAMYGLDDASLLWYKTVEEEMYKLGGKKLQSDPAIFYFHHPKKCHLEGMVGWHVDDINGGGSQYFYDNVMKPLMAKFQFGSMATDNFRCLGWNIEDGAIYISQKDYIAAKIEHLDIDKEGHTSKDFLNPELTTLVRCLIGKSRWGTDQTRPDLAFENLLLSMASHKPTYGDVTLLNKVVTRFKEQEIKLKYSKLEGDKWHITVFADASKGNLGNKVESTVAYLIFLSDGYQVNKKKKCNILAWQSKKARRVCVSTYDAEAMALNMGIQAGIVMKQHLKEIMNWGDPMIKVEAFTDCMDVYNAVP